MVGVYLIYSELDHNKCYIGSSINVERRLRQHFSLLKSNKHGNKKMQNYANKYGVDKLNSCILSVHNDISGEELRVIEKNNIIYLNGLEGFNLTAETSYSSQTEESKRKISEKAKIRQSSKEYKEKLSIIYSGTKSITSKLTKEETAVINYDRLKALATSCFCRLLERHP